MCRADRGFAYAERSGEERRRGPYLLVNISDPHRSTAEISGINEAPTFKGQRNRI